MGRKTQTVTGREITSIGSANTSLAGDHSMAEELSPFGIESAHYDDSFVYTTRLADANPATVRYLVSSAPLCGSDDLGVYWHASPWVVVPIAWTIVGIQNGR